MDVRRPEPETLPPAVYSAIGAALEAANPAIPLAQACADEATCVGLLEAVNRYVRWDRAAGYILAYFLQQVLQQAKSPHFPAACLLCADAQINMNEDLALTSLENGYLAAAFVVKDKPDEKVLAPLLRRMRNVFRFYQEEYGPRSYDQLNPLTYNLYHVASWSDLQEQCPQLRPPAAELTAEDYLETLAQLTEDDQLYWRVLGLRFLGHHYDGGEHYASALKYFSEALTLARSAGLDSEIGHLARHTGLMLRHLGRAFDARVQLSGQ